MYICVPAGREVPSAKLTTAGTVRLTTKHNHAPLKYAEYPVMQTATVRRHTECGELASFPGSPSSTRVCLDSTGTLRALEGEPGNEASGE